MDADPHLETEEETMTKERKKMILEDSASQIEESILRLDIAIKAESDETTEYYLDVLTKRNRLARQLSVIEEYLLML